MKRLNKWQRMPEPDTADSDSTSTDSIDDGDGWSPEPL